MKKVVLTSIPIQYHSYYQWLILGLYEVEKQQKITLHFRLPIYQHIFYFLLNDNLRKKWFRFLNKFKLLKNESYCLKGFLKTNNKNNKQQFVYDIGDSPFAFSKTHLQTVNTYFKAQCPITISEKGFRLTDDVYIPYTPDVLQHQNKIKPAMLGPRRLAWSIKYTALKKSYNNYIAQQNTNKTGNLMCYFGGAKGPTIKAVQTANNNFDGEDIIMYKFGNLLHHPNEKRYQLFRIIKKMGSTCDARVINKTGVQDEPFFLATDAPIPLKDFTSHVANFKYNANVSGFRLSIPNRFIESFMVGTAIVTDALAVKWYTNFEAEVVQLPEMGYLLTAQVNWPLIEEKVNALPAIDANTVLQQYQKNWAPAAFAAYIVNELSSVSNK
jgi:hypothetical protein